MKIAAIGLAAALAAGTASAQGALIGTDVLDDRLETIERDVNTDLARGDDALRFGPGQIRQGWSGSAALGFAATSGNTDTVDLSGAGRLRYGQGQDSHTLGFGIEYGEDDGDRSREELFAVYDYNRSLGERFYVFSLASYRYDDFDTLKHDAFVGIGPGYRVINTRATTWRLQAGPGVRFTEDAFGSDETEVAAIASSRFYTQLTETISMTNDTDVLYSDEAGALVRNDLGVNFAITDRASTRISYRTDYNTDPLPGRDSTDNRLGLSLVYGF